MVSHRTRKQGAGTRTAAVATSKAKAVASVRKDAQKGIPIRGAPLEILRASFALNQHPSVDQKAALCQECTMGKTKLDTWFVNERQKLKKGPTGEGNVYLAALEAMVVENLAKMSQERRQTDHRVLRSTQARTLAAQQYVPSIPMRENCGRPLPPRAVLVSECPRAICVLPKDTNMPMREEAAQLLLYLSRSGKFKPAGA